jgi:hypothetical protein
MTLARLTAALGAALVLAAPPAFAEAILGAAYDAAHDQIVVDIAYRGTRPGHEFSLQWGPCQAGVNARLIDKQGDDYALQDFRVRARFGLAGLPCRPAEVTLRLGRASQARVLVPALE